MAAVALAKAAGTQRWNRLRRFERVWDKSTTLRRHDPEQVIGMIIESPGGVCLISGADGVLAGLFSSQHDGGGAVNGEIVESPKDIYF